MKSRGLAFESRSVARARARIRGLVQGVFYRASTVQQAGRLGLTGWVKNERDGSVLLEAQGERSAVEELLAWCGEGPDGARVTGVDVEWIDDAAGEITFRVTR